MPPAAAELTQQQVLQIMYEIYTLRQRDVLHRLIWPKVPMKYHALPQTLSASTARAVRQHPFVPQQRISACVRHTDTVDEWLWLTVEPVETHRTVKHRPPASTGHLQRHRSLPRAAK